MIKKSDLVETIDKLIENCESARKYSYVEDEVLDEVFFKLGSLLRYFYTNTDIYQSLKKERDRYLDNDRPADTSFFLLSSILGVLRSLKFEVEHDLISSLTKNIESNILGDLLSISRNLIKDGRKEAASVLACGALEDGMKKYAASIGLDVEEKDLTEVVNAIRTSGKLQKLQLNLLQDFIHLRNKAFHAEFDKINMPEINSLISFLESFLNENFK